MTHDEMIAVIQAHKDGIQIQSRRKNGEKFADVNCPSWNFLDNEYRIKPDPMEIWVNLYPEPRASTDYSLYKTEDDAMRYRGANGRTVKFREVLDEDMK